MKPKFNPFSPNNPTYTGMFAGRIRELNRTDEILYQTANNNPTHIIFQGERGIGKTSLLMVANIFATGQFSWKENKHNFLTIKIIINERMNLIDFAICLRDTIERELRKNDKAYNFIKKAWDFFHQIEVAGFKMNKSSIPSSETTIINNLLFSISDTVKALTSERAVNELGFNTQKDGLVILIDEVDQANSSLSLGIFIKNLLETVAFEDANKILFILAGLPRLRDILKESHESSLRLFEDFELSTLSFDEVKEVVDRGINQLNEHKISIDDFAYKSIYEYSEGYPHFVQQICYSMLEDIKGPIITSNDVKTAMFKENGALDQIGNRYYKDLYYNKINVESYRKILRIMSNEWNGWITKSEIKKQFKGSDKTLDNGLHILKNRNIILHEEGSRGRYRLQWASFAFWIKYQSERH